MATIVTTNKDKRNVQCNPASSFPLMVIGSAVGALTSVNHLGLSNDNELTGLLCKIVLSVAFFPEMAEWLTCLPDHRQSRVLLNVRPRSTGFHGDGLRLFHLSPSLWLLETRLERE